MPSIFFTEISMPDGIKVTNIEFIGNVIRIDYNGPKLTNQKLQVTPQDPVKQIVHACDVILNAAADLKKLNVN